MSGHSKWANIQSTKVVADKKRGTIFTKYARLVTVAAREGGGDPAINFKLRMAIGDCRRMPFLLQFLNFGHNCFKTFRLNYS